MSQTLLLRLAAPTQAWHARRRYPDMGRESPVAIAQGHVELEPTWTGVVGMLAAALGRERGSDMSDLEHLEVLVRADQPGASRAEFATTREIGPTGKLRTKPLVDAVLDDAVFLVGVSGAPDTMTSIAAALDQPRWSLGLGRRCYPPTLPIRLDLLEQSAQAAARQHAWIAAPWWRATLTQQVQLRMTRVHRLPGSAPTVLEPAEISNPAGQDLGPPDWFAAVAGEPLTL